MQHLRLDNSAMDDFEDDTQESHSKGDDEKGKDDNKLREIARRRGGGGSSGYTTNSGLRSETVDFSADRLSTRGFEIDAFGLVSTPRGDYKREDRGRSSSGDYQGKSGEEGGSETTTTTTTLPGTGAKTRQHHPGASADDDLLRLGYLGRGAGGMVYKALHLPTLRLCAVKVVPVHDSKHRDQLVAEMKALRQNLVTWDHAQHATCAGCGDPSTLKKKNSSRVCMLCAKYFCGSCKKVFMDKTKLQNHTWKCKDDCDLMMFEDTQKHAHVALESLLDTSPSKSSRSSRGSSLSSSPASVGKSPMARLSNGLASMFHGKGSSPSTTTSTATNNRIVELNVGSTTSNSAKTTTTEQLSGKEMIGALRERLLKWNEGGMSEHQIFLTRQLILSAVAEERGARCPFMVELYNVFYTDQVKRNLLHLLCLIFICFLLPYLLTYYFFVLSFTLSFTFDSISAFLLSWN